MKSKVACSGLWPVIVHLNLRLSCSDLYIHLTRDIIFYNILASISKIHQILVFVSYVSYV